MEKQKLIKSINIKNWMNNFKKTFSGETSISGRRKLYNSLWGIFLGLILALVIISFNGTNPFEFISVVFLTTFGSSGSLFATILLVYVFASLAVGIGFKAGLFNIGVSGQMMFGGLLAFFYLIIVANSDANGNLFVDGGQIFLAIIISILGGISISLIAGALKAFLKVNEVVSTLLLNWVVFYFASWATSGSSFKSISATNSLKTVQVDSFFYEAGWIVLAIIMILIISIGFYFILKKTTFGYKIKAVGFNPDASEYAGISKKTLTMVIFAISGALAGFAGFFFYFIFQRGNYVTESVGPLLVGFDSIAISLLAYNSPIGIIASAFFYSILTNGNAALLQEVGLRPEANQIAVGVIIYFTAIAIAFNKFQLINYIKNWLILNKNSKYQKVLKDFKTQKSLYKQEHLKKIEQIKSLKSKNKLKWDQIKNDNKNKADVLLKKLSELKSKTDSNSIDQKVKIFNELNFNKKEMNIILESYGFFEQKDKDNLYYSQISELKNNLKKEKHEILYSYYKEKKLKKEEYKKLKSEQGVK
ncbi:ABC transporter permease [[Mycoplasma] mobile]|uniref:Unspecified sugar ABC transport permease protein n=1 Tax=Mycoplasma mobile (strain ATCC 43663 / 163K / NCTC 11711) TaxID=267748 RepID=Q6KIQ2_MYCM1|nr:ABC transporter permease [[Mycoplasma] mobile]AAT27524.1 unspecified sugar ABC transport permease protein [Mycoplasma mobile 163K]